MKNTLTVKINAWLEDAPIPEKYAFGKIPEEGHFALGGNYSPPILWEGAPDTTQSFVIICHDPDVPSVGDDVNQEGKTVPPDLPRVDFYHWVLVDIPADTSSLAEGLASKGVSPRGKAVGQKDYGIAGVNNYTQWFEGDEDMGGVYADYDGPCPPWNDSIIHHYHFTVYALDIPSLELSGDFGGSEALAAMEGHILAQGCYTGTYTMNPDLA